MQITIAILTLIGALTLIALCVSLYWISFSAMYSLMEAWWYRGHYARKSKYKQLGYTAWAFSLIATPGINTMALLICVAAQIVKVRRENTQLSFSRYTRV